jgi:hypothetical protein
MRRNRPQNRGHRWYRPDLNIEQDRAYLIGRGFTYAVGSPGARSAGALSRRIPQRNSPIGRPRISAAKIRPKLSKLQHTFWRATDPIPSHSLTPAGHAAMSTSRAASPLDCFIGQSSCRARLSNAG